MPGQVCEYSYFTFRWSYFFSFACNDSLELEHHLYPPDPPSVDDPCDNSENEPNKLLRCDYHEDDCDGEGHIVLAFVCGCPPDMACTFSSPERTVSACLP